MLYFVAVGLPPLSGRGKIPCNSSLADQTRSLRFKVQKSDPPSRGIFEHLVQQGASRTDASHFAGFMSVQGKWGSLAGAS